MHSLQLQVSRVMVSYRPNAITQIYRVEYFNFQLHNAAKNKFLTTMHSVFNFIALC